MTNPIISIENISKAYRLGRTAVQHAMFRDAMVGMFKANVRRLRNLRQPRRDDDLFWALKNITFEVRPGEVVGIIGRNGAGKSTLLKILSRITDPTEGQVTLRGRVASLLEVGTGFHPELSGRENVYLNGAILGMSKAEIDRKFDEIVAFAEIEQFLDTAVKHYSSGMYVRLAFAVAAHLEPEILIVDEVLAVGDIQFQKKCLGKMEGVVKEGRTVLFVSHQIAAVNTLCRHIVWLDQGKLADYGDASAIIPKYLSMGLSDAPKIIFSKPEGKVDLFFSKVSILDHEDKLSTELDALYPFSICLNYEVATPLTAVEMAIRIKTPDGNPVFTSVYSDYSDISRMDKTPGSYVASVQIPAQFLMPGNYTVSVHAFQFRGDYRPLQILDGVIRFRVCETGTKMGKYNNHKDIGVVLVNFPWRDERSIVMPA
jgi:lipopolysaccharide transport system ATP-binding protein